MCFGSNMNWKILYQIGVEVLLKKKMDKQCKSQGKDIRRKFKCVKDIYLKLNSLRCRCTHTYKQIQQHIQMNIHRLVWRRFSEEIIVFNKRKQEKWINKYSELRNHYKECNSGNYLTQFFMINWTLFSVLLLSFSSLSSFLMAAKDI